MESDKKRLRRLIAILDALSTNKVVTLRQLTSRFKVSARTIQRDINLLREAGIPVKTESPRSGCYFLDEGVSEELKGLTNAEKMFMVATKSPFFGLMSSFVKASQEVVGDISLPEEAVAIGLEYPIQLSEEQQEILKTLAGAILERKRVQFDYQKTPDETKSYRVEPYKLGYYRGFWYLVGKGESGTRSFALDKIENLKVLESRFRAMPRQVREMRNFRPFFCEGDPVEVVVEVSKEAAGYFKRKSFVQSQELLEDLEDGGAVFKLKASNLFEVENMVIKPWLPHVKVVEPQDFAFAVKKEMEVWMKDQIKTFRRKGGKILDGFLGAMLGMAIGDALGAPLEFKYPGEFAPVRGYTSGGIHNLPAGYWTDDTSMALCLAESLIECKGFNAKDQMERYLRWYEEGYLSSTERCFDIGKTILSALERFKRTGEPFAGSTDEYSAGNGSLMRLAPVPLYFYKDPRLAVDMAGESSRTTHGAQTCIDACRYFAGLIVGALMGVSKEDLLSPGWRPYGGRWQEHELHPQVWEIAQGSFKSKDPPEIKGGGFVIHCLEASLWAFYNSSSFEETVLKAVNLGEDADTTGAVCGQLAGAYYGERGIPDHLLEGLCKRELIEEFAYRLFLAADTC